MAQVVLRVAPWSDGFVGLQRHVIADGRWQLRRQQQVRLPAAMDNVELLRRIGDVDGDGTTDLFAIVLAPRQARLAFVVSGETLRVLGEVRLPTLRTDRPLSAAWLPPGAGKFGALLVGGTVEGQGVVLYTATPPGSVCASVAFPRIGPS